MIILKTESSKAGLAEQLVVVVTLRPGPSPTEVEVE